MDSAPVFHPTRSKYIVFTADIIIPFLIILGVVVGIYLLLFSKYFEITQIKCQLDFSECNDPAMISELNMLKGQNIFKFKTGSVRSRLTSGDFTIREASITRVLPGTVNINLASIYPVVALQVQGDPRWVVLDSKHRVIGSREQDPNVPTVIVKNKLTFAVGRPPADDLLIHSLDLAVRLSQQLTTIKSIVLNDQDNIELVLSSGIHAILTPKKDEQEQLRALQAVLSSATILKGVKTIDVRFSQPVLR